MISIDIFNINNDWDIGYTRRSIIEECKELGFSPTEIGEISIVINEICTNFIKHKAVEGTLTFKILREADRVGIEITAKDKGPGIKDINEIMKNGVSSKGTLGGGIGAIKRLMDSFEIFSNYDSSNYISVVESNHPWLDSIGTLIILKKWIYSPSNLLENDIKFSILSRPYPGMGVNGDDYYVKKFKDRCIFSVIDGLGHGLEAHLVSKLVSKIINENTHKSIDDILITINTEISDTRGAVAAILLIDTIKKEFQYSAVGNIEFRYILHGKTERFISTNGILGASSINKVRVHRKSYEKNAIITMCSDGIQNKWDSASYSGKDLSNPSVFARSVLKDFGKMNDDATVLVAVL